MSQISFESPLGVLTLWSDSISVTRLDWRVRVGRGDASGILAEGARQLDEYFARTRKVFDLLLDPRGSDFQQTFYAALCAIPYGETRTYGDLARNLDVSAQAIGQACGANPIPILIPCHRVLAVNGLGGYSGAGGVEAKVALLKLEGAASLLI